jgi:phosphatidylserine synthase 2
MAAAALSLAFCTEYLRDTLFVRPHPAVWRFATGCGLLYAMFLSFMLFQDLEDLRALMVYLDPKHSGKALPEKSYGETCDFTWTNVWGATDEFVLAHLFGWMFKATMIR